MIKGLLIEVTVHSVEQLMEFQWPQIPTKSDRVVVDLNGIGYVFEVVEVHYGSSGRVDIYLMRIDKISSYMAGKFLGSELKRFASFVKDQVENTGEAKFTVVDGAFLADDCTVLDNNGNGNLYRIERMGSILLHNYFLTDLGFQYKTDDRRNLIFSKR